MYAFHSKSKVLDCSVLVSCKKVKYIVTEAITVCSDVAHSNGVSLRFHLYLFNIYYCTVLYGVHKEREMVLFLGQNVKTKNGPVFPNTTTGVQVEWETAVRKRKH